ncbi:MAG: S8 family serine peptidase [Pseudomonadota bacterium]
MPKNPDGGPASSPNTSGTDAGTESRASSRSTGSAGGEASATSRDAGARSAGRAISERKKQYLIAPRHPVDGLQAMGFQPLSMSTIEQALRASPDIEVVDTVGPRNVVGVLADGMGGAQGVLVARMTEQKAAALHQQAQGRLVVERDQHLNLMDPALRQPGFVSSVLPNTGPALATVVTVLGKDQLPLADAEVSLFGSMLPATGTTDANGKVTLSLFGESVSTVRGLYVKAKSDYWTFYQRDPELSTDEANVVTLRALSDWPALAGLPRQKVMGWGQKAMRLDQLPGEYRGQGIKVAIIDSGAATTHDNLNRIHTGFDILDKNTNPNGWNEDTLGHGSHCAGVIGAADLAFGVRGFAPEAEIHVCKMFPGGQVSQLIDALEYCIEKQIDVVNLSLGGAEPSEALEQQIVRAKRAGIACIVAAGNSGGPLQYPASSPNVLAVAAIGKLDEFPADSYHAETLTQSVDALGYFPARFSCHGPQVGVCGPGVAICSTVPPNNYAAWDGTSMAAPHITGLAVLALAHHPDFQGNYKQRTAERVERLFQVIKLSARRVSLGDQSQTGFGLPDVLIATGLQAPATQAGLQTQAMLGKQAMYLQRGAQFDPFALDSVMAAYAAYMPGLYQRQQLGGLPANPFGIGTPGFNPGGW